MSYFNRTGDTIEEQQEETRPAGRLGGLGDRIARAFTGSERGRLQPPALYDEEAADYGPVSEHALAPSYAPVPARAPIPAQAPPTEIDTEAEVEGRFMPRFPVGPFGYSRAAVDDYLAELEQELDELRREHPVQPSINEEIERLGEQTASILVVAHDQAHETTRRAREQADRCIADAAANAVAITEKATQRLRDLDGETDAVWHERQRLLDDVRSTATAMLALADDAVERFPEEGKPATTEAPQLTEE